MIKPYLSVILKPPRDNETLFAGLIKLDRDLANEEFSYEIILLVKSPEELNTFSRFFHLLPNLKIIPVANVTSIRGSWQLFTKISYADIVGAFKRMTSNSADSRGLIIGAQQYQNLVKNFLIRKLLRGAKKDYLTCLRCFGDEVAKEVVTERGFDWHCDIDPIIIAEKRGVKIETIKVSGAPICDLSFNRVVTSIFRLKNRVA